MQRFEDCPVCDDENVGDFAAPRLSPPLVQVEDIQRDTTIQELLDKIGQQLGGKSSAFKGSLRLYVEESISKSPAMPQPGMTAVDGDARSAATNASEPSASDGDTCAAATDASEPSASSAAAHVAAAARASAASANAAEPSPDTEAALPERSPRLLDPTSTVEAADLFNLFAASGQESGCRVIISNLDPGNYWHERKRVDAPAHNPTPRAPEHLALLNQLASEKASKHHRQTHLPRYSKDWRKLQVHAQHIAAPPVRCCFQCGMLNYPKDGDEILVQNISTKHDCRAYRVFRYYIQKLISDRGGRHPDETTRENAKNEVFLCEPEPNGGCRVYSCSACKRLCAKRGTGRTTYEQCSTDRLDLFDGHRSNGSYDTIGIGDKQPKEYAVLTVKDRMSLAVLQVRHSISKHTSTTHLPHLTASSHAQMADATFKAYGGAGYTHSGGGGLLQPNDFHGLAALLVESKNATDKGGSMQRRRDALRRLLDPVWGNSLVRSTLSCLEMELQGSMPTIPEGCDDDSSGDDADSDGDARSGGGGGGTLLHGQHFVGAAVSMLPPGEMTQALSCEPATLGVTHARRGGPKKVQPMDGTSSRKNADVAAFPTLLPHRDGGFAPTERGCTRRHYVHKMLGSVAPLFRRAEEVRLPPPSPPPPPSYMT